MDDAVMPSNRLIQEETKRAVVEETLLQAFNPFSTLKKDQYPKAERRSVVTYTVQQGDTLSGIAQRYGLSLQDLLRENKLTNPHMAGIGMKLIINQDHLTHIVAKGETLDQIAKRYHVPKEWLIRRNPLLQMLPDTLYVGQLLYVPRPAGSSLYAGGTTNRRQLALAASRKAGRGRWLDWPVKGATITSGFGVRWGKLHKGLDLWNEEEARTPIYAANEGTVVEAGANQSGYGYMVILDHGDGLRTYYAHMRKIIVTLGQVVGQGEILGYMGRTGDSTGFHLHFEVRQDDVPLNPLRYLPR